MTARRTVIRRALLLLAAAWLLPAAAAAAQAGAASEVVLARNPRAIDGRGQCDPAEVTRLLDRALLELTGAKTAAGAWKALGLVPSDTVAIKVNCNNWTIHLSPKPELVTALCRSLQSLVPANRIIVYDNDPDALREAGFTLNRSAGGVRFTGTGDDGFDGSERLTLILTRDATKVINLASLKTVDEKDLIVSLLLKNHIGSLIPADMPKCHGDHDFLAGVCAKPAIRGKTVLNIVTGLRGTYQRGVPWYWAGLVLGRDPLAVETAAIGVINGKRRAEGLAPLPLPRYLGIAMDKYKLGTCDPARIREIRVDL